MADDDDDNYDFECETFDTDDVSVRLPDGSFKHECILIPVDGSGASPRERRLQNPDVTVDQEKERFLSDILSIPRNQYQNYEMVIILPQNEVRVMNDAAHISNYRNELCRGAEVSVEIRPRNVVGGQVISGPDRDPNPIHPEDMNFNLK